jgi:hypothetical protein
LGNVEVYEPHSPAERTAVDLAMDLLLDRPSSTPTSSSLRRLVADVRDRHRADFDSSLRLLGLPGPDDSGVDSFRTVVGQVFADRKFNWGRLVTVYAFSSALFEHCCRPTDNEVWRERMAERLGEETARLLGKWIVENGDWEEFDRFAAVTSSSKDRRQPEPTFWRRYLVPMVGLGAMAALIVAN